MSSLAHDPPGLQANCTPKVVDKVLKRVYVDVKDTAKKRIGRHMVEVGTIYLGALDASYQLAGQNKKAVFWVVFLKTKKIYNFPEHLKSSMRVRTTKQAILTPHEEFYTNNVKAVLKNVFSLSVGVGNKEDDHQFEKAVEVFFLQRWIAVIRPGLAFACCVGHRWARLTFLEPGL